MGSVRQNSPRRHPWCRHADGWLSLTTALPEKPSGRRNFAPPAWLSESDYLNGMPFVRVVQRTAEWPVAPYGRRLVIIGL
jgi:hypothetical protein